MDDPAPAGLAGLAGSELESLRVLLEKATGPTVNDG